MSVLANISPNIKYIIASLLSGSVGLIYGKIEAQGEQKAKLDALQVQVNSYILTADAKFEKIVELRVGQAHIEERLVEQGRQLDRVTNKLDVILKQTK